MSTTASSASGGKRVVFTGGSGKAGRHVIPYLLSKRHKILNLDLVPFPDPHADVYTLKADLTNSGQVFNALTTHFNMREYGAPYPPQAPDVIHFGACARSVANKVLFAYFANSFQQHDSS